LGQPAPTHGQQRTPYTDALRREADRQLVRAQAPGHGGSGFPEDFVEILRDYAHFDVSVMAGVDVPLVPGTRTPLQEAEELCAELYGAGSCRFVTTGATHASQGGALTMFEAAGRGKSLVVQASVHISVIDALSRTGAEVDMVPPEMSPLGVATVLHPNALERVLNGREDIGGVIISTPSYEGAVADMQRLVEIAHARGVPVMIDSAWGSELGLSPLLPGSALQAGADLVVGSPHKELRAPGQAAWIFRGPRSLISEVVFGGVVRAQLSTSKAAPFLAGLDSARRDAALYASERILRSITTVAEEADRFRRRGLGHLLVEWDDVPNHIPYRLVFNLQETGHTGYELGAKLREEHGVQVAQSNILFICCGFGVGADSQIRATFRALEQVVRGLPKRLPLQDVPVPPLRLRKVDFRGVPGSGVQVVPLRDAIGRRAKFPMGGYPPGFCVLVPGAEIQAEDIDYLEEIISLGAVRFGPPAEVPPGQVAVIPE
jgi:arginine decarboxylase